LVAAVRRFKVRLLAKDVPGSGYATYKVLASQGSPPRQESDLDVLIGSSVIRISSKEGHSIVARMPHFESGGDIGDEYRYVAPLRDRVIKSSNGLKSNSLVEQGPAGVTYRLDYEMRVPERASADEAERSENLVLLPITAWVRITPGSRRVECTTQVHNSARDHRLRVVFPIMENVEESTAEGHFEAMTRPAKPPEEWGPEASTFYPMQSWCDASETIEPQKEEDEEEDKPEWLKQFEAENAWSPHGYAVLNRGLREYEQYTGKGSVMHAGLAVTLLRCVGRVSGGGDAPGAELVPGAQCQGTYTFDYALYPHMGGWEEARVWQEAHAFATPLRAVQTDAHDGPLPPVGRFMEVFAPEFTE
jgi:alpha-mannosidase